MPEIFVKQAVAFKQAILGRREPHQLAWGLALGVLLGFVAHGNLIAVALVMLILSVRVNHALVAVTAVVTTLVAVSLDAQTHSVGKFLLTDPDFAYRLSAAWQWPIVPWTDLNNTVVMGSLVIGVAAMLPTYLFSYPIFHALSPSGHELYGDDFDPPPDNTRSASAYRGGDQAGSYRRIDIPGEQSPVFELDDSRVVPIFHPLPASDATSVDAAFTDVARAEQAAARQTVDTRIEVVRISDTVAKASATARNPVGLADLETAANETVQEDQPMSEALNYLLRQLRDSRQGRAA